MKYLPKRNLFFVHIPKCAGMSIHQALDIPSEVDVSSVAQDLGISQAEAARITLVKSQAKPTVSSRKTGEDGFTHSKLGQIHPIHLPLEFLRAEMPETWNVLKGARSFAMVRAPRARFISALLQHMGEFGGGLPSDINGQSLEREAARICEWLDAHQSFADARYIHFARQVDFVCLDGARVITKVFPVSNTPALTAWIASTTGLSVDIPHAHSRRLPKSWAGGLVGAARKAGKQVLPKPLRKRLYPLWMKSGMFADAAKKYADVDLGSDVEGFVSRYYAPDQALLAEAEVSAQGGDRAPS